MSDRDKLGADHDLDHMLDAIRYKVRRLSDEGDDAALRDVWRHLQDAARETGQSSARSIADRVSAIWEGEYRKAAQDARAATAALLWGSLQATKDDDP